LDRGSCFGWGENVRQYHDGFGDSDEQCVKYYAQARGKSGRLRQSPAHPPFDRLRAGFDRLRAGFDRLRAGFDRLRVSG